MVLDLGARAVSAGLVEPVLLHQAVERHPRDLELLRGLDHVLAVALRAERMTCSSAASRACCSVTRAALAGAPLQAQVGRVM